MAAGITDLFTQATNGTRPVPTTLTSSRAISAATISCGALTGWPTGTAVHFIIYTVNTSGEKVAGSQTDWKGIVSGTTITNCTLKAGSDSGDSIGAIVECGPSAAWANDIVAGMVQDHGQLGYHKNLTDANGNEWIKQTATASAVNELTVANAATTKPVILSATGGDTNVDIRLAGKGTGKAYADSVNEFGFDYVVSGLVWTGDSYGGSLAASMTAGICYISGYRITLAAVTARAFTTNVDTYIDVLSNQDGTGALVYTTAATNAASPALASNSIRIGIIQAAATITAATKVNQGQEDRVFPIASSIPYAVTDSLGNLICPRDPNRKVLGYRQIVSNFTTTSVTAVQVTGLTMPIIVPTGRKVRLTFYSPQSVSSSVASLQHNIYDGTPTTTPVQVATTTIAGAAYVAAVINQVVTTPTSASKTYNAAVNNSGGFTTTLTAGATQPVYIMAELV